MGDVVGRLDRWQRRHPALGAPIAVIYKFFDDQGAYLGALIAFYAFLSLFPLFLLFSTILGFALENNPQLRDDILASAARQIPVIGAQIEAEQLHGSGAALVAAICTATFGSLGVAQAIQNAMNVVWGVRRNERPNPVASRVRSLVLLGTLGLFVVATTVISQIGAVLGDRLPWFTQTSAVTFTIGSFALSVVLFMVISRLGTAAQPSFRELLPGALLAGVLWQGLQIGGNAFVTGVIARSPGANGVFAVVIGLITWLYIAGGCLVLCLEVNIVHARHLYPRSLLTPMTDRVDLTEADQQAYTRLARAQSLKGFQNVEVTFDYDGQYASARRRHLAENPDGVEPTVILRIRQGVKRLPTTLPGVPGVSNLPIIPVIADALPRWIGQGGSSDEGGRANPAPTGTSGHPPAEPAPR